MSDSAKEMQNANSRESAFGRPADWRAAWPAVVVGLTAFLLAVYGTFWLPRKLPAQYSQALAQAQLRYQTLVEKPGGGGSERLVDTAGEMDVIHSRLVVLEGNSPERYWQWAEFQQAHADRLSAILQDPAVSLSPAVRKRWSEQAQHFRAKSHEILDQLALRPSELQAQAVLHVAQRKYRTGLGELGIREASSLAESLASMLAAASVGHEAALTLQQIQKARLLLVQMQLESAWQTHPGSSLTYDAERLEKAWETLERFYPTADGGASGHIGQSDAVEWRATRSLLTAMTGRELSKASAGDEADGDAEAKEGGGSPNFGAKLGSAYHPNWTEELSKLQLAAVEENWTEVASQLGSRAGRLEAAVTTGLARTVCRLTASPWADQAKHVEVGVMLAAQLSPHMPETGELLWNCARAQAGAKKDGAIVPESVIQAIMAGESGWLKHSLASLAATLEDKPDVANTHLQLLFRGQGNTSLVARVVLWRCQRLAMPEISNGIEKPSGDEQAGIGVPNHKASEREELQLQELGQSIGLMSSAVQVEPESGLNWFVLGTLQFRAGQFDAMHSSLAKAREFLGDMPAIEQMLEEASK